MLSADTGKLPGPVFTASVCTMGRVSAVRIHEQTYWFSLTYLGWHSGPSGGVAA